MYWSAIEENAQKIWLHKIRGNEGYVGWKMSCSQAERLHDPKDKLTSEQQTKYCPCLGKLLHLMQYNTVGKLYEYGKQSKVLNVARDLPHPWAMENVSGSKCSTLRCSMDESCGDE